MNYFTGAHFGNGNLHVPIGWKKFYGPFYYYVNEGAEPEELIQDALLTAKAEQAKWPYQWVDDPLYPLVRGNVTGRLCFEGGVPCTHATVILGQKELPVELQSADYIYYAETDSDGCFALENVRFGSYLQITGSSCCSRSVIRTSSTLSCSVLLPPVWYAKRE